MFEFWSIRYRLGRVTKAQLLMLVPDKLTQAEYDEITASPGNGAESEENNAV